LGRKKNPSLCSVISTQAYTLDCSDLDFFNEA
jgi:hypothetical protein